MNPYKLIAIQVARKAGAVLKKKMGSKRTIGYKGAINLVTEMDFLSEKIIVDEIERHFPDHAVLAEERPPVEKSSRFLWIIDPLDGTTNYAHGYPVFPYPLLWPKMERSF